MHHVAVVCTAALGLLLFVLGFAVSTVRYLDRTFTGYTPEPGHLLAKLVRAHGNTAEYAPFLAVLFLYLGSRNPAQWHLWLMVAATVCRFLVVVGLMAWPMSKPNPVRFVGAIGTYIFGAALCAALLNGA